jgi:hypothetical protein
MKQRVAGLILAAGVAAGFTFAGDTAHAETGLLPLYPWCPGQKWQYLIPPPPGFDMTVCHNLEAKSNADGTFTIVELPPAPPPRMCGPVPCGLFP